MELSLLTIIIAILLKGDPEDAIQLHFLTINIRFRGRSVVVPARTPSASNCTVNASQEENTAGTIVIAAIAKTIVRMNTLELRPSLKYLRGIQMLLEQKSLRIRDKIFK